jgi:hypothetical protein
VAKRIIDRLEIVEAEVRFSDKCLKKWYLLPPMGLIAGAPQEIPRSACLFKRRLREINNEKIAVPRARGR